MHGQNAKPTQERVSPKTLKQNTDWDCSVDKSKYKFPNELEIGDRFSYAMSFKVYEVLTKLKIDPEFESNYTCCFCKQEARHQTRYIFDASSGTSSDSIGIRLRSDEKCFMENYLDYISNSTEFKMFYDELIFDSNDLSRIFKQEMMPLLKGTREIMLPINTQLGNLRIDRILEYYDGPRLFVAKNSLDEMFLALWVEDRDEGELWIYALISEDRLRDIESGSVSIRSAYTNADGGMVFRLIIDDDSKAVIFETMPSSNINLEELPPENDYIG